MAKVGTVSVDLDAKIAKFESDMGRAARIMERDLQRQASASKRAMDAMEKGAKAAGAAIGAMAVGAAVAVAGLTMRAINAADAMDEMSAKVGIGTEQLSKWGYAAKLSGTDLDGLSRGIGLLSKNMAAALDAESSMGRLFEGLGVSVKDAAGNLRSVEDVLPEIADRFAALDNHTLETALSMQLFGKSGADLLEFLNRGSQGLDNMGDELARLGGVIDSETAAAAAGFKDELDKLQIATEGLGLLMAGQLAPALAETTKEFRGIVTNGELAANMVAVIQGAMSAGLGVINLYNQAVERTTILMEMVARQGAGAWQAYKNLATWGIADGSVAGGIGEIYQAGQDGIRQREEADRRRAAAAAAKPGVIFAGEGAEPTGMFAMSEQELRLRKQQEELQARLQALLADRGGGGGAKASKGTDNALREAQKLADAQGRWHDRLLDMQADLEGPVAQANRNYERQLSDLERAFQAGEVGLADYAKAQDLLAESRNRDLQAIAEQITPTEQLIEDMKFENALLAMNNRERAVAIAQRYADKDATAKQREEIRLLAEENLRGAQVAQFWDQTQRDLSDSMLGVIQRTKSAKDAVLDFVDAFNERILRGITDGWADAIVDGFKKIAAAQGSAGAGSGSGGWMQAIGGFLGNLITGGRAIGGPVSAGGLYRIHERGEPEFFQPASNGRVVPLSRLTPQERDGGGWGGSGRSVTQNIQFNVEGRIDRRSQNQIASDMWRAGYMASVRRG